MKRLKRYFTSYAKLGIVIILGLAVLSGCSSEAFIAGNQYPDYFIIDNYVGRACDDIAGDVQEQFTVNQINVFSSKQESGVIVNQYPCPGKEAIKGSELTLYVSSGASPDGLKLDGLQSNHSEGMLKQAGISYTIEKQYDLNTEKGYVFGTGKNGDEAILYVSLGQPELNVSGVPGYASKSGDYIFYTDDRHIYSMHPNGTNKQSLIEAKNMLEIIPYDDWIVYHDIQSKILHIDNWQDREKSTAIFKVNAVYKVVDGMVYFEDDNGFKKYSLQSKNTYYVEKKENDSSVSDVIFKNNYLYYSYSYTIKDNEFNCLFKRLNCLTGEKNTLDDKNQIYVLYFDGKNIYWENSLGISYFDETKMQGNQIAGSISGSINVVYDNTIIYESYDDDLIYALDVVTGQKTELCDYYDLLWIDKRNDWVYFIKDNATYRMRSSGQEEEFFSDAIISSSYYTMPSYDCIPSIDGWLYFFDENSVLSRINIDSREIEKIVSEPMEMPWWARR